MGPPLLSGTWAIWVVSAGLGELVSHKWESGQSRGVGWLANQRCAEGIGRVLSGLLTGAIGWPARRGLSVCPKAARPHMPKH